MKKLKEFDCPSCGNPLQESRKSLIKCPYCETVIIPQYSTLKRKAAIYEKEKH